MILIEVDKSKLIAKLQLLHKQQQCYGAIIALFTRSTKNFVGRAFFLGSLMYAGNFLRSKVCLKEQKYARRTKFFTLRVNRA